MSPQTSHGRTLIPRPEHTPDALRAALAVVAAERLPEMQRTKDEAFAQAVEWQSLSPVRSWVLAWARDIEIARRPDLATRYAHAHANLEHEDDTVAQEALRELTAILGKASFYASPRFQRLWDENFAVGRLNAAVESLLIVLDVRGIDVPQETRERITGCDDCELLRTWLLQAVTATSIDEVFDTDSTGAE